MVDSFANFLIVGSLPDIRMDVHAASNDQQNAVACSIASSHEDPHEATSISSCVDLNSQSVFPCLVSQGMDPGLQTVPSTSPEYG